MANSIGRYQIRQELGKGGMGTVYHGFDPRFERDVAVKVLPREFLHNPTFRERFNREARAIAQLEHPYIVPVYDFGEHDGMPYLVMRYMAGGSLKDHIEAERMTLPRVVDVFMRVGEALDAAHRRGVIHRDVKPGNILFDTEGRAYLSDFGIAKFTEATAQLTGDALIGTPAYMAPELANEGVVSPRSDIYALGVTLYQTLTGQTPFSAPTPVSVLIKHINTPVPNLHQFRTDLPETTQDVVDRALAKDPDRRFQTGMALASALERVLVEGADAPYFDDTMPSARDMAPASAPPPAPTPVPVAPPMPQSHMEARDDRSRGLFSRIPTLVVIGCGGLFATALIVGFIVLVLSTGWLSIDGSTISIGGGGDAPPAAAPTTPAAAAGSGGGTSAAGGVAASSPTLTPPPSMPTPTRTLTPTTPADPVLAAAVQGVESNDAWQPVIREFDGVQMVLVPTGCFLMGDANGYADEAPTQRICIETPFWIDRYEVTMNAMGVDSEAEFNLPAQAVDWFDARDHCTARGGRLPSEAEWEYAASGPDNLAYPWGDEQEVRANFEGSSRVQVGSYPDAASWVGAHDMAGNVFEWTNSKFLPYPYDPTAGREDPGGSENRVYRGGSYASTTFDVRTAYRGNRAPDYASGGLGFRCVLPLGGG